MQQRRSVAVMAMVAATMLVAAACSGDDDGAGAPSSGSDGSRVERAGYEAAVQRTSFGVPHITADDVGSLGFGAGYAFAQDHACDLADQVVKVRSERAKWFGAGEDDANLTSDLASLTMGVYERAEASWPEVEGDTRKVISGYAAGYNAYLAETDPADLPGWCAGEEWVQPVDEVDLLAYYRDLALAASGRQLVEFMGAPQPPEPGAAPTTTSQAAGLGLTGATLASNGWALGAEKATENGMVLANPHFPWQGELRLWEQHLTVPGELDVYGVGLLGVPAVLIGFNDAVAWTHTFSSGNRFTGYLLDLVPGDPTSYLVDGEPEQMTSEDVTVEVRQPDGSLAAERRTLWSSRYGPIIDFPGLGWSSEQAVTFRDANIDNAGLLDQFLGMNRAGSLEEFQQVFEEVQGIPWVNTMAVSRDGQAWYIDGSATPNLSDEAIARWQEARTTDPITKLGYEQGFVVLDGSDSTFEWVEDPGAATPGLVPYADQPQLSRDDFVFNANDSYWLANPDEPLTGYSPLHGLAEVRQSLRTRMNAIQIDEGAGSDGRFTIEELQDAVLGNEALSAELLLDGVVRDVCGADPGDLADACGALASWDRRFDLESRGAALWRLFLGEYSADGPAGFDAALFSVPFDAEDPIGTPNTADFADPAAREQARTVLRQARADLQAAGFAVDTPYGEVAYTERAGERIGLHGAPGDPAGIMNATGYSTLSTTLEPGLERPDLVREDSSLTKEGWPVNYGTSFVMTMEFTDDGPRAQALLTYGESGDPGSPEYSEQMQRFAKKAWRDILWTDEQIEADPELREYSVSGARGG